MAITKQKGDLAEVAIMKDLLKKGYKVSIPFGEDNKYDLIVLKKNKFLRLQCKYSKVKNNMIRVRCRSANNWKLLKYTAKDIDYIVVYNIVNDTCYYIPSKMFKNGRNAINLRLTPPKSGRRKDVNWASNFTKF